MKTNPTQLFKKIVGIYCLLLAAPLVVMAQQTVFNDTFGSSTVGLTSTPGGTFTASSTSYDFASGKSISSLASIGIATSPGHLGVNMLGTGAAYIDGQAIFTSYPITLTYPGDAIDVQFIFTDTTNIFNGTESSGHSLAVGLFYSGGSAPYTNLYNSGLVSSSSTAATGGAQNWLGYRGNLAYGGLGGGSGASATSATQSRPAQNQGNNLNQALIQAGSGGYAGNVNLGQNANTIAPLTIGNQYTVDFKITLQANGSLAMTNTLYAGVGTSGTVLATNNASASGANILTTNFDALCIGGDRTAGAAAGPTTNDVNQIIITFTSTNQAGPYFVVTGVGGCGSDTINLNGSVTTNVYYLYTNGVNSGQSIAGTGSPISFGVQTAAATYTVIASNTVTGSMGPMFGSTILSQGAPTFIVNPSSVICATNSMAVFSAQALGSALSFQWYKNGVALTNGGDVSGALTTNLVISPAQAADAGTVATGYYLVMTNPCGYSVTSSPNAALTLEAPYSLVWQGDGVSNVWDLATTANFLNGATSQAFTNGDNVTFNDSSANTSVTITGNTIVPTLVTVTSATSQSYIFGGRGSIVGSASVLVNGNVTLTITNNNTYTGGTVISNSATLSLGDGTRPGKVGRAITVNNGTTLHYFPGTTATTIQNNTVSGTGNIVYDLNGVAQTITLDSTMTNSSFGGTGEIKPGVRLQVTTSAALGGTNIIVDDNYPLSGQLYVNGASITNTAAISIIGHGPASPVDTPYGQGALRLNSTWVGPITIAGVDSADGPTETAIGAAGGTATILGNITDNGNGYQLEYYSGTFNVGPTTGLNTYGVTRITEGLSGASPNSTSLATTVVALNTNAFSTNTLNMNAQAILKLNGNNLQFNNLIDESETAYNVSNFVPVILNGSTNATATITLGRDNGSQSFYGRFGDGGSKYLGLTKVGSGTLTLSGDSTNTGPVTVAAGTLALSQATVTFYNFSSITESGSFSNATAFAIYNGATLDVSGRSDQTLMLNSGQTLEGSGSSIGTIHVAGNVNIGNGTLLLGLNRTNTPSKSDSLTASGSITYGGILAVTNIGPILQVGDSFQLFGGATPGFAAYNLQANDYVNNVVYTWNNTINSNGKITVATVSPLAAPPVAGFIGMPTNIFVTQAVVFTNTSTGNITNSAWSFGDGNFVTNSGVNASNNVSNIYNTAGTYTVSLIVSGNGGSNTNTQANYIVVKPKAVIGKLALSGGNLVLSGTNGPVGQQYRILTSTNVASALANWTPVYTNFVAPDGSYGYTNTLATNPARFFLLVSP